MIHKCFIFSQRLTKILNLLDFLESLLAFVTSQKVMVKKSGTFLKCISPKKLNNSAFANLKIHKLNWKQWFPSQVNFIKLYKYHIESQSFTPIQEIQQVWQNMKSRHGFRQFKTFRNSVSAIIVRIIKRANFERRHKMKEMVQKSYLIFSMERCVRPRQHLIVS